MSKVRVCFLGTPEFAVTCLKALLDDDHFEIVGVVTQPDRPAGRKLQLTPSPVKSLAQAHGLRVLSPESLKDNQLMFDEIRRWEAEVGVVVAFGQILTQEFMDSFKLGCVNVHASLLPKWRGAAPIQRSLEAGDKVTGVALQKMVKKLDAGGVIGSRTMELDNEINAAELFEKLAFLGADLLRVELMDYVRGNLAPVPQDESQVTVAKKIGKTESEIPWSLSAERIHDRVRGFAAGPGTYTWLDGKRLKILKTRVRGTDGSGVTPGTVVEANENALTVACGKGVLEILELQPESSKKMTVAEFMRGQGLSKGKVLGKGS